MRIRRAFPFLSLALALILALSAGMEAKSKKKEKKSSPKQEQTVSGKVDLNSASQKDLEELPGVGPATAKKIINNRPYSSLDDLRKADVSDSVISKIRGKVTVSAVEKESRAEKRAERESRESKATEPPATEPSKSESAQTSAPSTSGNLPQSDVAARAPGSGMVWVNTDTKIYHREGDRWYGKTEHGDYMSEAEAKAKGNRPDRGKVCSER